MVNMCSQIDNFCTTPLDGAVRYTEASARRETLLRRVIDEGYIASAALAAELGVSEMTIRRDIAKLDDDGLVHRVLGGARAVEHAVPGFHERSRQHSPAKLAVARSAAALLSPGTIGIDAGTTAALIVPLLPTGSCVVTHSAPVIADVEARDDLELIAVGGLYHRSSRSFIGPGALSTITDLALDDVVISVAGIDDGHLLVADALEAPVKRLLMASARRVIVVADSTKIGHRAAIRLAPVERAHDLVTDHGVSSSAVRELRALTRVHLAPIAAVA